MRTRLRWFAGQELLVRHGPWDGDVSFRAPLIRDTGSGNPIRVRATALCQPMTGVAQAVATAPRVNPEVADLVGRASVAQGPGVPTDEFVSAVERVAGSGALGCRDGARLSRALQRLERAVGQYQAWAARAQEIEP